MRITIGAAVLAMLSLPGAWAQHRGGGAPAARSAAPAFHPAAPTFHPAAPAFHPAAPAMHSTPAGSNHSMGASPNRLSPSRPATGAMHSSVAHPGPSHAGPGRPESVHPAAGVHTAGGGTRVSRPGGGSEFHGAHGEQAHFDRSGHVRDIHTANMHIEHRPDGMRHVVMDRPDHSRMVMYGHDRGYIQRSYMYHGHAFYHRDYYMHGVRYSRFYRPYYYHGVYLNGYMPARYYAPGFYGWAYAPWAAPVPYAWGWGAAPWYGYYGPYFAPYPVYYSPSLWLTDYLIAQSLQDAYQQGVAAGAAGYAEYDGDTTVRGGGGAHLIYASYSPSGATATVLTPQVKQLIATEVQADLAVKRAAAQSGGSGNTDLGGLAQLLSDGKQHVFVVSTGVSATDAGQDCALTEGDVLQSGAVPAGNAASIDLTVLASKKKDCRIGASVPVSFEDLQEMQNHLMATVDQGLGELSAHPGQGGLPKPPAAVLQAPTDAPYASQAPASDPNVAQELAQGDQEASQTEQAVLTQAAPAGAMQQHSPVGGLSSAGKSSGGPVVIALGQTPAQVIASKGAPQRIASLGAKQIYFYPDMKIYFEGNKVSDVQ
jgi:hypothetical protein